MKLEKILIKFAFLAFVAFFAAGLANAQGAPRQEKLLNGLKILMWSDLKSDKGAEKVSVKIRVHSGSAFDPLGREGVMQMLSDNLFPNEAVREFFTDDLGGGLEVVTTYDYIQINASSKPENMLQMIETLANAVSNPAIDKETTAKLKTAMLAKVAALEADPSYVADQAVAKRLFGSFPYGRPQMGTADSIKKIDFADLIDADKKFLTADNATITITGNYDKNLAFKAIRRYFGSWLKADKKVPSTFSQPNPPAVELSTVPSPKPEAAAIRFSVRGVARSDKDFAAAEVYAAIIEARLRSRLPADRADDVFVRNQARTLPGDIVIGFAATIKEPLNSKTNAVDEVTRAMTAPLTEADVNAAKTAVAAEFAKRDFWLDAYTYGIGGVQTDMKAVDSVTLFDVSAFSEKVRKLPMAMVMVATAPKSN